MTQGPNYADSDDISLDIGYRSALKMKHGGKDARRRLLPPKKGKRRVKMRPRE